LITTPRNAMLIYRRVAPKLVIALALAVSAAVEAPTTSSQSIPLSGAFC
jgi:hypothetical protein